MTTVTQHPDSDQQQRRTRTVYELLNHPPQDSAYTALQQPGAYMPTVWGAANNSEGIRHTTSHPVWAARIHANPRPVAVATSIAASSVVIIGLVTRHAPIPTLLAATALIMAGYLAWSVTPITTRAQGESDVVLATLLALHPVPGSHGALPEPVLQILGETAITSIRDDGTLWRPHTLADQEAAAQLVLDMADTWATRPTTAIQTQLLEIASHLPDTGAAAAQARCQLSR